MLSKRNIEKEIGKGINIFPLHPKNIKENSINFTISQNAWALGSGTVCKDSRRHFIIDKTGKNTEGKIHITKGGSAVYKDRNKSYLILLPHVTTVVETHEVIGVSNYIGGTLHSKVGIVAQGVGDTSTMLGPCFCGHLMISLHNVTDELIVIPVGETFVSLVFHYLNIPSNGVKNPNVSGHVDKLSELGIKITTKTREYLTEDWKTSVDGIRDKMKNSKEYKEYKKHNSRNKLRVVREYLNMQNIVVTFVLVMTIIIAGFIAYNLDKQNGNGVWTERFWTIVSTGFIIPGIMALKKLFKRT